MEDLFDEIFAADDDYEEYFHTKNQQSEEQKRQKSKGYDSKD